MAKKLISLRLEDWLKQAAEIAAEDELRSFNNFVEVALKEKLTRDGYLGETKAGWVGDENDPRQKILDAIRANNPESRQLPENK